MLLTHVAYLPDQISSIVTLDIRLLLDSSLLLRAEPFF